MKRDKIIYWTSTGIVSAMMILSSFMYLSKNPDLINNFKSIGFPLHFVMFLGTAKLLGSIALLVPGFEKIKEWAYAGFAFTFIGAVYTHLVTGTPFVIPLVVLIILGISYLFSKRLSA